MGSKNGSASHDPLLIVRDVAFGYGEIIVIRHGSFGLTRGHACCLVGRNGAGKTTLLAGISGLLRARSGLVSFAGKDITRASPWDRSRLGIGFVQEGRHILRSMTVGENITLGTRGDDRKKRQRALIIEEQCALFPALAGTLGKRAGDLSGGQQQMLAIAQALAGRPSLLILDEPSSGLAPVIMDQIVETLGHLKESGMTILLAEQLIDTALSELADDVVVLDQGQVIYSGEASAKAWKTVAEVSDLT